MSKRSQDHNESATPPSWWTTTGDWIRSSGGTIHSSLVLKANRDVMTTTHVANDTTLMEIPSTCLVSRESIISTKTGMLFESIISDESLSFYNQRQDLLFAMCLAASQSDKCFQRYLDTLPPSSEYDMLPRRWKDSELKELLTGSCLLDRVMKSRAETKQEYETIKTAWTNLSNDADAADFLFPSYSDFDDMLAAVTSRAFAGMGGTSDEDIAMVPLLDLCNHRRGNVTKNVSYVKTASGTVRVVASRDLDADTVLAITYGARGNAQLLFNYGFCIPDNMEPDGSCNDVLEFKAKAHLPAVDLRSGPKSYTFGGFAKVLEMFHETDDQQNETNDGGFGGGGGMEDMEAFLNECDEEGEGGWDDEEGEDGMEDDELSEEETIKAELVALAAMQKAFEEAKAKYLLKGDELEQALAESGSTKRHYAALLVASELRTIFLYELGIQTVRAKLAKDEASSDRVTCALTLTKEDEERVKKQAKELAQAFIGIRYPFL